LKLPQQATTAYKDTQQLLNQRKTFTTRKLKDNTHISSDNSLGVAQSHYTFITCIPITKLRQVLNLRKAQPTTY